MARFGPLHIAAAFVLLLLSLASALPAADSVEVIVEGLDGDVLQNVQRALALPPGLIREGKADRLWLERFLQQAEEKVRAAIEPFGYYNGQVTTHVETAGDGVYRLRVKVEPGAPVLVTEVSVVLHGPGAEEAPLKETMAAFKISTGSVLLQEKYEEAKRALLSRAQEMGYLDAEFSVHEIRVAKAESTARINLVLETGERYFFDGVRIEGAPEYPEPFLRRYLAFKSGDVFSYSGLGQTQLNFANSERFREVNVTPEKTEARDFHVPVLVQLKPAPRRSLLQGIGYGTDTGARISARYRDLNIGQRGHEFQSTLYIAERLQGVNAGYTVPDAADAKSSVTLQMNLQKEDTSSYVSSIAAVELDLNRSVGKQSMATPYLRLQLEDYTVGAEDSRARLVLPGFRFSQNLVDNPSRPTRGVRYAFDLRGTSGLLGSTTELLQFIGAGSSILPLPWRLSFQTRVQVGISLLNDPLSELPPSLRFFTGGDQSVRGYEYQSLGPKDDTGEVVGGKHLLVGSVELERALFADWGVSVFYDAGNAFDSFANLRLYEGAGVGLHYYTKVGGLNLSLARQIGVEDPGYRIHFTVGFEL